MKYILFFLLPIVIISCNKPAPDNARKMDLLADRMCRAITIRQQRFELANKIRFAQDTLQGTKSKTDSVRLAKSLAEYLKQKPLLLKESLSLADTIHHQLDSLVPYTDKSAEKRFNTQLDTLLSKKGCLVKTRQPDLPNN